MFNLMMDDAVDDVLLHNHAQQGLFRQLRVFRARENNEFPENQGAKHDERFRFNAQMLEYLEDRLRPYLESETTRNHALTQRESVRFIFETVVEI